MQAPPEATGGGAPAELNAPPRAFAASAGVQAPQGAGFGTVDPLAAKNPQIPFAFMFPRDPALLGYPNPMGALYSDSCFGRMPPAFLIGLGGGAAFAFVMETFSNNGVANYTLGAPMPPSKPLKEEFGVMARSYGKATVRMSKNFAPMSAVFVYSECLCEKARGKHDMWNPIIGGCAAGAALSAPTKSATAMAGGCAMFAAFSAAMEVFMGNH